MAKHRSPASGPAPARYVYAFEIAGRSTVEFDPEVIRGLRKLGQSTHGGTTGGVLLGSFDAEAGTIVVDDHRIGFSTTADPKSGMTAHLSQAIDRWDMLSRSGSVTGLFWISDAASTSVIDILDEAKVCLKGRSGLLAVIEPGPSPVAQVYLLAAGSVSRTADLRFQLDEKQFQAFGPEMEEPAPPPPKAAFAAAAAAGSARTAPYYSAAPHVPPAPRLLEPPAFAPAVQPPRAGVWRPAHVAALAGAGLILVAAAAYLPKLTSSTAPAAAVSVEPAPMMRIQLLGSELQISWDAANPHIRSAAQAHLEIQDGDRGRAMVLDNDQLVTSRVLYVPRTEEVSVQFVTLGKGGKTERLRIIVPRDEQVRAAAKTFAPPAREATVAPVLETVRTRTMSELPVGEMAVAKPTKTFFAPGRPSEPVPQPAVASDVPEVRMAPQPLAQPLPTALAALPPAPPAAATLTSAGPVTKYAPPVLLRYQSLTFPRALQSLATGPVTVDLTVSLDERGKVLRAQPKEARSQVERSLGAFAASSARYWTFRPAHRDGTPVAATYDLHIVFNRNSGRVR